MLKTQKASTEHGTWKRGNYALQNSKKSRTKLFQANKQNRAV